MKRCKEESCLTILSIYNDTDHCALHSKPDYKITHYVPTEPQYASIPKAKCPWCGCFVNIEGNLCRTCARPEARPYLWTTNAFLVEAHELARAWGFKPKTMLTWVKTYQDDPERVSSRTGYWFRGATEHVLFGVRGSLRLQASEVLPTAYLWPRIGQHSVKPEAFYDLVEKASPGPYLELFARRNRLGWDTWGNESLEHVELSS